MIFLVPNLSYLYKTPKVQHSYWTGINAGPKVTCFTTGINLSYYMQIAEIISEEI